MTSNDNDRPFAGVVPPILTPWNADGDVDVAALEKLAGRLMAAGVDGIFALGSSGEVAFMDDATRETVLRTVIGTVAGQVPVLAGLIDMETNRVIQHGLRAKALGADAIVSTAPFYAITGPAETKRHFELISAAVELPQFAYDIPVCTHSKLTPTLLMDLGASGVITGVKDSSGDDVSFRRLARFNMAAGEPLTLLTGHEVAVDGAYPAGGHGSVPGLGNVDPDGYVRLHRAALAKDWDAVKSEQDRLADLFEIVFVPVDRVGPAAGIGAFKTALVELGVFPSNRMSEPMTSLGEDERAGIRKILAGAGLV